MAKGISLELNLLSHHHGNRKRLQCWLLRGQLWTAEATLSSLLKNLSGAKIKYFHRVDFAKTQGPTVIKTAVCLQRPSAINESDGLGRHPPNRCIQNNVAKEQCWVLADLCRGPERTHKVGESSIYTGNSWKKSRED